nr:hypothetical protein [Megavirus caiporensis]
MSSQENLYSVSDISLPDNNDKCYIIDGDICDEINENILPTNRYRRESVIQDDGSNNIPGGDNINDDNIDDNANNLSDYESDGMTDNENDENDDENDENDDNDDNDNNDNNDDNDDNNNDDNNNDDNNDNNNDDNNDNNNDNDNNNNDNNDDNNDNDNDNDNNDNNDNNNNNNNDNNGNNNIFTHIPEISHNQLIPHHENEPIERKKRGPPKTILANQQKYLENLEKQNRMSGKNKKNTNNKLPLPIIKNSKNENVDVPKRRVVIGGKLKYLPVKQESQLSGGNNNSESKEDENLLSDKDIYINGNNNNDDGNNDNNKNDNNNDNDGGDNNNDNNNDDNNDEIYLNTVKRRPLSTNKFSKNRNLQPKSLQDVNVKNNNITTETSTRKLPSSLAKKMEMHAAKVKDINSNNKKTKQSSGKKIPSKYARQIENDVKKQTVKNVKNFSDLRRVRTLQDISPDYIIDANKASITELRKLRLEQKKKEQAESRKRAEENKRESAVQEILKNDKMSKFAKTVAIKNLSANSRHKRKSVIQNKIDKY